jgi:uncharacterized protein
MIPALIKIDPSTLTEYCLKHRIRKLALFGSVLGNDFTPASDIDVLIEFEPDAHATFFDMGQVQQDLSEMFGRIVDLKTAPALSPYFREEVLATAQVIYEYSL